MRSTWTNVALMAGVLALAVLGYWSTDHAEEYARHVPRVEQKLSQAITSGDLQAVKLILDDRPDLANSTIDTVPALHFAAQINQVEIMMCLLERGADRSVRGDWETTPLQWAAWCGATKSVERLVELGYAVEDRSDTNAWTPLLYAARGSTLNGIPGIPRDFAGTVRVLIDHGASVNIKTGTGRSALAVASEDVAKVLIERGAARQTHPSTRPSRFALTM